MEKEKSSMYSQLGVDAHKSIVKEAFINLTDNKFPRAFVNIITDPNNLYQSITQHQDGDGSKMVQRFLSFYEENNPRVFRGAVDDAISMNTGDVASAGFVFGAWVISNVLNLNLSPELKKIFLTEISARFTKLKKLYNENGFDNIKFLGGETADLPDQVKSAVFDVTITAWAKNNEIVTGEVEPGDTIFGFKSDGQANWEARRNSGLMSNGLTLARSALMHKEYNRKYPSLKREGNFYKGRFHTYDAPFSLGNMSVGEALLSPTRQWAIVIKKLIQILRREDIVSSLHGIVMNTGGGATKIKNIGQGINYIKEMPLMPLIFQLIKEESGESWCNLYQTFNCGVGLDIVGDDSKEFAAAVKEAGEVCGVASLQLGHCGRNNTKENKVILLTGTGQFKY